MQKKKKLDVRKTNVTAENIFNHMNETVLAVVPV